ncbi:MAG: imidazole glycerol phosphate synthase, glutamine amidotransferase subunit [Clostridiales bacterium GWC2_40_7]|nr:MAG: imidazole glycerol phosphate synthase, glutamine amidotransferase subunit [Clostridiales bacterium GWC2_40_7]
MIAIIDYGVGNLRSVEKAFHFIGCDAVITSDVKAASEAECIVLPGVGAFSDAMENLRNAGMVGVVKDAIAANKPFLGICLGMQLLFDYSEEGGSRVEGLGIFRGAIKQLPQDIGLKVPHMGWNSLNMKEASPLFDKIPLNPYVYFVHSFYLAAEDRELVAATVEYGVRFDAAIGRGNVFATQFHPEKSGSIGLDMLRNWAALKPRISAV